MNAQRIPTVTQSNCQRTEVVSAHHQVSTVQPAQDIQSVGRVLVQDHGARRGIIGRIVDAHPGRAQFVGDDDFPFDSLVDSVFSKRNRVRSF